MNEISGQNDIYQMIYFLKGRYVMLDRDLATLYDVETRVLNQAVKRNINRFPLNYCFQMSEPEFLNWKSQFVISNSSKMGLRKRPFAFTEQGVAMLSTVLRSETAVKISIQIMDSFVKMRHILNNNSNLINKIDQLELRQTSSEKKIERILDKLQKEPDTNAYGVFSKGQIFDALHFISDLVRSAEKSIKIIDNYIDDRVLKILSKRKQKVKADIYSNGIDQKLKNDIVKHNQQYPVIYLHFTSSFHDRFLILDDKFIYHIGASIKDLGTKCFAFSKMDDTSLKLVLKELKKTSNQYPLP